MFPEVGISILELGMSPQPRVQEMMSDQHGCTQQQQ